MKVGPQWQKENYSQFIAEYRHFTEKIVKVGLFGTEKELQGVYCRVSIQGN